MTFFKGDQVKFVDQFQDNGKLIRREVQGRVVGFSMSTLSIKVKGEGIWHIQRQNVEKGNLK